MIVYIRVDANTSVGFGHLMRTLSLALAFKSFKKTVVFISSDFEVQNVSKNYGFDFIDNEKLIDSNIGNKVLVLDGYEFDNKYIEICKEQFDKVIYFDDFIDNTINSDAIINNCLGIDESFYRIKDGVRYYLGEKYILFRPKIYDALVNKKTLQVEMKKMLITTGGSDKFEILKWIPILANEKFSNIKIKIVVGNAIHYEEELFNLYKNYSNIEIKINASEEEMVDIFLSSDVAISSGGSTIYELCAFGVPTLVIKVADNQNHLVDSMNKKGTIHYIGDISDVSNDDVNYAMDLISEYEYRKYLNGNCRDFFNENGAENLARDIIADFSK
ncbi:MAG: UDP-2,4-diacetamido-2,4,6-trideoxy-beta-L-altropyranose hydrolase [Acidaminobacteraceae bacterium]